MSQNDLRPGDVIDGKYEVLSLLGTGGMGRVFKARHIHLDAMRTIKVLRRDVMADESYRVRFAREAQLATRVQHPNVAMVHDFATLADGTTYMVSEFIEGVTLRQWLQAHGRFSLELTLQLAIQVLSGLDVIHRAGLMHRDISTENIMVATGIDGAPLAKIIDLGIAKANDAPSSDATQAGLFVGNPCYSSPEQLGALHAGEVIDARGDIYSFGVVLYEMLTGVSPFASKTPHEYAVKHLTQRPRPLREREPAIPEALDRIVLKALEKQRDLRYASAREMATALAPFRTGTLTTTTQAKLGALRGSDKNPAVDDEVEDAALVAVLLEETTPTEDELMERHRAERAAFHAAIDALEAGNPAPSEELLRRGVPPHIQERLKTGLLEHHGTIAWGSVRKSDDPEALRAFLKDYPNHRASREAKERLRGLEEQAANGATAELQAWNAAIAEGTEAAWLRFLEHHKGTPRAREAVSMLAETRDHQRAIAAGTELALRVYLATWPQGRHYADVDAALTRMRGGIPRPKPSAPAASALPPAHGRAVPLTALEMIPGTVSEAIPTGTAEMPLPSARISLWVYAIGAAITAVVIIAAVLWY